jgi:hypothetical protein
MLDGTARLIQPIVQHQSKEVESKLGENLNPLENKLVKTLETKVRQLQSQLEFETTNNEKRNTMNLQ